MIATNNLTTTDRQTQANSQLHEHGREEKNMDKSLYKAGEKIPGHLDYAFILARDGYFRYFPKGMENFYNDKKPKKSLRALA
jgi:hypothetical protein